MILLQIAEDAAKPNNSWTFIILSEVIITLIVFVGAYYIFKPVFKKDAERREAERLKEEAEKNDNKTDSVTDQETH